MEFGKAFTYVFEDQEWIKKILIAGLMMLIPLVGQFFLMGWMLETIRRVIMRDPQPLADWNDFGGLLVKGLKAFVVGLVYSLPIILVSVCGGAGFAMLGGGDAESPSTAAGVVLLCFVCLVMIYVILLALIMPAALGNLASDGNVGAAFRFGDVFGLVKAAPGAYILTVVGVFLAGIISNLGGILCFIGIFFTIAYATAVNAHLYGQAYNVAKGAGAYSA